MIESAIDPLVPADPRVAVGRFTYGSPRFMLWTPDERIGIGAFCSIANDVTIFGGGEHHGEWVSTFPVRIAFGLASVGEEQNPTSKGPTTIGNDVWIGHGATILSGVRIGDGAIIGARALVAKNVEPYQVVAGNPARPFKKRFTDAQIRALCEIAWWDWPLERIREHADLLNDSDVDAFIARARRAPASGK